jgi:hypothetical protein
MASVGWPFVIAASNARANAAVSETLRSVRTAMPSDGNNYQDA